MEIDLSELAPRDVYFRMISTIVPRPIAWVSTVSIDGKPNLAPFSFFTGVTSKPPTLVFCVGNKRGGVPKDTVANIMATGEFVVNMVCETLTQSMVQTSAPYDASIDEFQAAGVEQCPAVRVSAPRVAAAPVCYECTLHEIVEIKHGDRITSRMVIGNILHMHISDDVLSSTGEVDIARLNPVSRLGGQLYGLVGEPFEIPRPTAE